MNVGVICELNPFHNGHRAVFEFAKGLGGGGNTVVAVMSGNYTQRGEPAVVDKWIRARMAVMGGADIVLEIPSVFAQQSAQFFADAAVDVLCRSGLCDALVFGSESGDLAFLRSLADKKLSDGFGEEIKKLMDGGLSYPRALAALYGCELGSNDTLGVEYLVALAKRSSPIQVHCMKRVGQADHGDPEITGEGRITSAASLRRAIAAGSTDELSQYMPGPCAELLVGLVEKGFFVPSIESYNSLIIGKIREMGPEGVARLPFASEGLAAKIFDAACGTSSVEKVVELATSRTFTSGRIRRILLSVLTGAAADMLGDRLTVPYVRVLAVSKERPDLLSTLSGIGGPVIIGNVPKNYADVFPAEVAEILRLEILASDYYVLGMRSPDVNAHKELTTPLIRV